MSEIIKITFQDAYPSGVSREEGKAARGWLRGLLELHGGIELGFDGVEVLTPSFADEVFGKLLDELGEDRFRQTIRFSGGTSEVRTLVNQILRIRLAQLRQAHA